VSDAKTGSEIDVINGYPGYSHKQRMNQVRIARDFTVKGCECLNTIRNSGNP
jgi:hypothetical protein